jgi:hypothetical protein
MGSTSMDSARLKILGGVGNKNPCTTIIKTLKGKILGGKCVCIEHDYIFFEIGSHYEAQDGLKLMILLPQSSKELEL